jgi:hypothetical protein
MSGKQVKFLYVSAGNMLSVPDKIESDIKPLQAEGYDLLQVVMLSNANAMVILQKNGGSTPAKKMWGGKTRRSKRSKKSNTRTTKK